MLTCFEGDRTRTKAGMDSLSLPLLSFQGQAIHREDA